MARQRQRLFAVAERQHGIVSPLVQPGCFAGNAETKVGRVGKLGIFFRRMAKVQPAPLSGRERDQMGVIDRVRNGHECRLLNRNMSNVWKR